LVIVGGVFFLSYHQGEVESSTVLALAAATFLVLWTPVAIDGQKISLAISSPLGLHALGYTVFFIVPAIAAALSPTGPSGDDMSEYPTVLSLLAVSYALLVVGYHVRVGDRIAGLARRLTNLPDLDLQGNRGVVAILACYIVGWLARLINILNGTFYHTAQTAFRYTGWGNLVGQVEWLCKIATIALVARAILYPRLRAARAMAIAVASLEILTNGIAGNREQVGEVLLYACLLYMLVRHRLPRVALIVGGPLLICSFIFMGAFRQTYANSFRVLNERDIGGAVWAVSDTWQHLLADPTGYLNGLEALNRRDSDIVSVAAIVRDTPSVYDFEYGRTYLGIILFPIPRLLWPDKPTLTIALETTPRYFPESDPYNYASTPTTLFGEFYLNFGIAGCLLGMFLWGIYLKLLYSYCRPLEWRTPTYLCFYVFSAAYMFWVSQTAGVMVAVLRAWCVFFIMGAFGRKKVHRHSALIRPPARLRMPRSAG
jgi:hypothetical protein